MVFPITNQNTVIELLRQVIREVIADQVDEVLVIVRSPKDYDRSDPAMGYYQVDLGHQGKFLFQISNCWSKNVPRSDKASRLALVQAIAFLQKAHGWSTVSCYIRTGSKISISFRWKREATDERGSETWEGCGKTF